MKKLLIGLTLFASISTFGADIFTCRVYLNGSEIDELNESALVAGGTPGNYTVVNHLHASTTDFEYFSKYNPVLDNLEVTFIDNVTQARSVLKVRSDLKSKAELSLKSYDNGFLSSEYREGKLSCGFEKNNSLGLSLVN